MYASESMSRLTWLRPDIPLSPPLSPWRYQRWQDIQNKIYDRRALAGRWEDGKWVVVQWVKLEWQTGNNKMKSTLRNKRNDNVAKWAYLSSKRVGTRWLLGPCKVFRLSAELNLENFSVENLINVSLLWLTSINKEGISKHQDQRLGPGQRSWGLSG